MKYFVLTGLILFVYNFSNSQILIKNEYEKRYEFSSFSRGYEHSMKDPVTWENSYFYTFKADYSAYIFPFKKLNLGLGLNGTYAMIFTNYSSVKPYKSIGLIGRYYFPYRINFFLFKKMLFFAEMNYGLTDFTIENKQFINLQSMSEIILSVPFGLKLPFFRDFSLDIRVQYINLNGNEFFIARSGVIYSLKIKKKETEFLSE